MDSWRKCQGVIHRCPLQICQSFPKIFGTPKSLKALKTRHKPCGSCYELWTHWFLGANLGPPSIQSHPALWTGISGSKRPVDPSGCGQWTFSACRTWEIPLTLLHLWKGLQQGKKTKCCRSNCLKPKFCQCRFPSISSETNSGKKRPYGKGCPLICGIRFLLVHLPLDFYLPMHINVCYVLLGSFL